MIAYAKSLDELESLMVATAQTKGLNVLEHGRKVRESYLRLDDESCPMFSTLRPLLVDDQEIARYQIYHDCGKALCAADGHFPDHAKISSEQWSRLFPDEGCVSALMAMDMLFHTGRGDEIVELWKHPLAPTLYLTAWAEIYANAEMFGGVESDSFKIKKKRLIQAGKKYG